MAHNRPTDPGTRLRLAREARGLSIRFVAETTKLSVRAIETLEGNRLSALPGGIYRRGMIRAVAKEVGLDGDQMLREFAVAHPDDFPASEETTATAASPSRRSFQGAMAFVGTILPLLAGVTYFGWPTTPSTGAVPARVKPSGRATDVWRPEIVPAGGFTVPPPALSRPVVVTLTISSTCQLRIVADGREVLGRTMEQGETLPIELGEELLLLGDNAAAVQFSINGQAGRRLGEPGGVLSARIGRDDYEDFLVRH